MTALEDDLYGATGWEPSAAVIAAEAAVVGTAIASRAAAEAAAETVRPTDLFKSMHAVVFEAVLDLINAGHPISETVVLKELTRRGEVARVGGLELAELMRHAAPGSLTYNARTVVADAERRRIHSFASRVLQRTGNPRFDPETEVDVIRKEFEDAVASRVGDDPPTVGELLMDVLEDLEQPLSGEDMLPPPYIDLEMLIPGFRPGQMIVIGARPSIGKTLTAMDCARAAALRLRLPTLVFSLEMSRSELMHRLLAAEASVSLDRFAKHQLTDDDWRRIANIQARVQGAPMVIDDSAHCTLARIRARLRGMQSRFGGCRLVVVDYLTLLEAPRAESRERAVAEMARGIKLIAKEFGVPILLLAQLNRASEHRTDKKPILSDLRESGGIEADADVVILLHREDFYDKESPRSGELDLIVAKHRNGPTGTAPVAFQGHYSRAVDMASTPPPHPWSQS